MIMEKRTKRFVIGIIVFLLAGCATVKDVQRATDLIRTDNELTRLLVEVRPNDQTGAAIYLSGLATHAKSEADALKGDRGKIPDAIAYYRIAATAYWRSGRPEVVNDLFEVTDNGTKLCADLGKNAPDRDCLFLQLVIPFAGLESNAKNMDLSNLLKGVNFNDGSATPDEIATMGKVRESFIQVKPLIQKIFAVGEDNRFLSHPGMREYYCENAKKAFNYYDSTAATFVTKVKEFHENITDNKPPLGITIDDARGIRELKRGVPGFCR
jgi:hypothetical protein